MRLMVDSFLTYARDTTGEPITDVDLVNLLAKLLTRFEPTIKLIILGTPRKVSLKETSIVRALENLIMNATRYGDKIELVAEFNNSEIRIGVHDNGTGIPTDKREQAVLPFVRLEPARNQNNGSGVGLGLAIAADVARSHGGQLILSDSKKLGGLSAQIVLPT